MRIVVTTKFTNKSFSEFENPISNKAELNVSNLEQIVSKISNGCKGFQLSGVSKLDGSTRFFPAAGYPGYISGDLSNDEGLINDVITVRIVGSIPPRIYVTFDSVSKEYAVDFTVSNSQNDKVVVISGNTKNSVAIDTSSLELVSSGGIIDDEIDLIFSFTKWSKPGASTKVTSIRTYQVIGFTGKDLINVRCSENLFDAQMQVTPGICEQFADISVYDRQNLLHERAAEGALSDDYEILVDAIDDVTGIQSSLGAYVASEWNVKSTASEVSITCRDKSYLFEKINIARSGIADRTLHEFLTILFNQAPGMSWTYLDYETEDRCKSILVPSSWYGASDLYTMLTKVCALGMLRIYWYIDTFIVGRCV